MSLFKRVGVYVASAVLFPSLAYSQQGYECKPVVKYVCLDNPSTTDTDKDFAVNLLIVPCQGPTEKLFLTNYSSAYEYCIKYISGLNAALEGQYNGKN